MTRRSPAYEEAHTRLVRGDAPGAIAVAARAVEAASPRDLARALYELGEIAHAAQDTVTAIDAYRRALALAVDDEDDARAHLDYALGLGMALLAAGRTRDALRILAAQCEARAAMYAADDPRVAIGFAAHAEGLLSTGAFADALERIAEAVTIFTETRDPLLPAALALEAEIVLRSNADVAPFAELFDLDAPGVEAIVAAGERRAKHLDPKTRFRLFGALDVFTTSRLGAAHAVTVRVRTARARSALDDADRHAALQSLIEGLEGGHPPVELLVEALLDKGLVEWRQGDVDAALATHHDATEHARAAPERAIRSRALRLSALLALDVGRHDLAKDLADRAQLEADASDDDERVRALATRGVVLLHSGWLDAARAALEDARAQLDPDDPDAPWVEAHYAGLSARVRPAPTVGHLADAHRRADG